MKTSCSPPPIGPTFPGIAFPNTSSIACASIVPKVRWKRPADTTSATRVPDAGDPRGSRAARGFPTRAGIESVLIGGQTAPSETGARDLGLYEKAWPEIISAFRELELGHPAEFYDALSPPVFPWAKASSAPSASFRPNRIPGCTPKPAAWAWASLSARAIRSWASKTAAGRVRRTAGRLSRHWRGGRKHHRKRHAGPLRTLRRESRQGAATAG